MKFGNTWSDENGNMTTTIPTAAAILRSCREGGANIAVEHGRSLAVTGRDDVLTPSVLAILTEFKPVLLELLLWFDGDDRHESPISPTVLAEVVARCNDRLPESDVLAASRIIHKQAQCQSLQWWRHVHGGRYCSKCWPCADALARVEGAGGCPSMTLSSSTVVSAPPVPAVAWRVSTTDSESYPTRKSSGSH